MWGVNLQAGLADVLLTSGWWAEVHLRCSAAIKDCLLPLAASRAANLIEHIAGRILVLLAVSTAAIAATATDPTVATAIAAAALVRLSTLAHLPRMHPARWQVAAPSR